jgi:hypothetical protein
METVTGRVFSDDEMKDAIFNFACIWTREYVEDAGKLVLEEEFYVFYENVLGFTYNRLDAFRIVWRVFSDAVNGTEMDDGYDIFMEDFMVQTLLNFNCVTPGGAFLSLSTSMLKKIGEMSSE